MVKNEGGIALATTLVIMTVVSALIAGIIFVGTQEQRVADNTRNGEQAFGAAETGVYEVLRTWSPTKMSNHGLVGTDSILIADALSPQNTGRYGGTVYKLTNDMYLIDVTGKDSLGLRATARGDVPARSRQGLLVRIRSISFPAPPGKAAVTVGAGGVKINGSASVNGYDSIPPTWTGCPPPDSAIGILTSGTVSSNNGNNNKNPVLGTPPTDSTPQLVDSNFTVFGGVAYSEVASAATITLAPGSYNPAPLVVNGVCDVSNTLNWGDGVNHAQPCGGYYPIVHITGSATVTGSVQGILLVDGDLSLGGNLQWFGALIVQGALKAAGGGGKLSTNVWGIALIHGGVDLAGASKFSGSVNFQYSKCGLTQALNGTSTVSVSRSRAWSQLY